MQHWALQPPLWPRGRKLRIVMVADLHAGVPGMSEARVRAVVAQANGLGGDVIALMGDYRASHRWQVRRVPIGVTAPLLAALAAPLGVYAIQGNHDWEDHLLDGGTADGPTPTEVALRGVGIAVLNNQAVRIGQGTGAFWLAGLDSQSAFQLPPLGRVDDWVGKSDLAGTLTQMVDDAPAILLAHEPDIFAEVPERFALTLSGHTHGGQFRVAGWSPFVPSQFGTRYMYGCVREGRRDLVVSGGLGCSALPLRIGAPPEITVVDLS